MARKKSTVKKQESMGAKTVMLHGMRVEPRRKARYERAWARCQKKNPDMTLADWVRWACDQQANMDLARRSG